MNKKTTALLLTSCMVLGTLSACGGQSSNAAQQPSASPAVTADQGDADQAAAASVPKPLILVWIMMLDTVYSTL